MRTSLARSYWGAAAAFTLVEVMMGLMVLGLVTTSTYYSLLAANSAAAAARLQTGAITELQNRVDFILSASPFTPQKGLYPSKDTVASPRVETPDFTLRVGTYVQTNVPIYTDPTNPTLVVRGTMTTVVADSGVAVGGASLNTYRATVTLAYTYRKRSYSVSMSTLRASDE